MSTVQVITPTGQVGHLSYSPFEHAVIGYLQQYRDASATRRAYEADLKNWFAYCQTIELDPTYASRGHLDRYINWMQDNPRGWSESTICRRIGTVCGVYKYGYGEEILQKDPSVRVKRPQIDHAKQRCTFLPPVEFAILLKHVTRHGTPMEQAYVALLGLRGLRISEACSLDVTDFREERGYRTLRFIGKGRKARVVAVPGPAVRAIERAIGDRTEGPILLNQAGNRMNRVNGDLMLKRLARAAGVDDQISNHSLRRSFVTAAKASGESYDDIAETVGHASTATTRRYDRLIGTLDRDISHGVAGFLSNLAG